MCALLRYGHYGLQYSCSAADSRMIGSTCCTAYASVLTSISLKPEHLISLISLLGYSDIVCCQTRALFFVTTINRFIDAIRRQKVSGAAVSRTVRRRERPVRLVALAGTGHRRAALARRKSSLYLAIVLSPLSMTATCRARKVPRFAVHTTRCHMQRLCRPPRASVMRKGLGSAISSHRSARPFARSEILYGRASVRRTWKTRSTLQ